MTTFMNANQVGDKYRDATGGISTIVHLDSTRLVIRRSGSSRFPTFTAYTPNREKLVRSNCRTLAEALAA